MLRDAVHTVALAVLTAGGAASRPVRDTALEAVHDAGFSDCTEDQLIGLLAALAADEGRAPGSGSYDALDGAVDGCGTWLSIELHEALEPLTRHLEPQGREHILFQGARIALADGPYLPRRARGAGRGRPVAATGRRTTPRASSKSRRPHAVLGGGLVDRREPARDPHDIPWPGRPGSRAAASGPGRVGAPGGYATMNA